MSTKYNPGETERCQSVIPEHHFNCEGGKRKKPSARGQWNGCTLVGLGSKEVEGIEDFFRLVGNEGSLLIVKDDLLLVGDGIHPVDVNMGLGGEVTKDIGYADL